MVTAQDDLMFVEAENAAFEFARYGHDSPLEISLRQDFQTRRQFPIRQGPESKHERTSECKRG
jgi:hypothetical protein